MIEKSKGFDAFIRAALRQKGVKAVAGVFGEPADYALANEFGTERIPQRSFIRSAMDELGQEALEDYAKDVRRGRSFDEAADGLAETLAETIRWKIAIGPFVPNASSTVKRKGPGKPPLIDTGEMLKSVKGEVRRGEQ